jgi:hypothetical protein
MKKILVLAESLNKNKSSEGISTVNFLNSIDTDQFEVSCLFYEFPQFEVVDVDWINPKIHLYQIRNTWIDFFLTKIKKIKNFFSYVFGISLLKEYRVRRIKNKLNKKFSNEKFDLIFSRTVATSICSHRALIASSLNNKFKTIVYFNDPVPFSLMPASYRLKESYNPRFDRREIVHVKRIINNSSIIASPSKLLNDFFLKLSGELSKPTLTFPHLFFSSNYDLNIDCSEYLDPTKINITHCGSLLLGRNPSFFVQAVADFLQQYPDYSNKISVNFFGSIDPTFTKFWELSTFDFIKISNKRVPHNLSLALMYQSDLPVLIEGGDEESPFMPVKLAELIGLGKIFLALSPVKSETRRILGKDYLFQTEAKNQPEIISILHSFLKKEFNQEKEMACISGLLAYVSPESINSTINQIIQNPSSSVLPK